MIALLFAGVTMVGCDANTMKDEEGGINDLFENFANDSSKDAIAGKHWKLIELNGEKISSAGSQDTEIHFFLEKHYNRVTGFAGCNTFSGKYKLKWGQRIRFTSMVKTMEVCPRVTFDERKLFETLQLADNYTVEGDTLNLQFGRRAPLAVFEAVPADFPIKAGADTVGTRIYFPPPISKWVSKPPL